MDNSTTDPTPKRIAVVTGSNKGIGLETCCQLLSNGMRVVLTARDEAKGAVAVEKLRASAPTDVVFHQLDVTDPRSVDAFAHFVKTQFGKLDILVNNAGILGKPPRSQLPPDSVSTGETYQGAEDCLNTNYYGAKRVTEALMPLLLISQSPRIVNVSSIYGKLQHIPSKDLQKEINDIDTLTEDRLDELVQSFLNDFKNGDLGKNGWPTLSSAYRVSKVAVNAYTRLLAKRFPTICCSCVDPGFVRTDMNGNAGILPVQEGAKVVVTAALLPDGSPSGLFYDANHVSSYE
ncbi:hypothetical protein LUZ63_001916 [Rhynchospora breviuscula]|uniref:(+)-neomenthol dehydrogenase-like n=1 Tax=Rhynchospora breviuscula TaxID=2022672 RepID=A0A9Q0CXR9_9POAL|nr:hypothetical protein LUZ63_001916 [Rhynchospora breviuscula]